MNVDIDQFIMDQKAKIAEERSYLTKNVTIENRVKSDDRFIKPELTLSNGRMLKNDDFILKMREGENMKNRYKQELRNDFSATKQLNKHMEPYSARREKVSSDTSDDEGLLHGFRYSNSATKRKEKVRNEEYNEFKAMEESKFRNRFANKKSGMSGKRTGNETLIRSNPISPDSPPSLERPYNRSAMPQQELSVVQYVTPSTHGRMSESKIDELERKVEELRNFRIQNPYIIYPNDDAHVRREEPNSLRYSSTNLGKSHLRYLEETEQRLKEIEDKYDSTKSSFLREHRGSSRKLKAILDDEDVFGRDVFEHKTTGLRLGENSRQQDAKSIVPTGRENDEEAKKRRQAEYRRELEVQMKEKADKTRPSDVYVSNNFFDKFGQKEAPRRQETANGQSEKDNDYFFYASRNPLDEFDLSVNTTFKSGFSVRPSETARGSELGEHREAKKEYNLFFGERDNNANKNNYRHELIKQIEESKVRKEVEKRKLEDYERRKNEEIARYEPFGRGGGGAPLRNEKGETISDLKRVMFDPEIVKRDPPSLKPNFAVRQEYVGQTVAEPPNSQRGFARGGNGIFGNALSDEDKVRAERYKEDLQIQIEKNRRQKDIEKENERIKEENERMKFEREQKQIQMELDNEKKRQQEKELEHQRLLDENKVATIKEKERMEHAKLVSEKKAEERRVLTPATRSSSPIRRRESIEDRSKLEIEATGRALRSAGNREVMDQVYKLKDQLKSERLQVERALVHQRDEVEIYDPRLNRHDAPRSNGKMEEDFKSDIFQAIIDNKKPQTVRRDHLKTKAVTARRSSNTEAEQDEYLRQQEKMLERMNRKDFSKLELMMPRMEPQHVGLRPGTQMSNQLESDSAFLRFDQSHDFPLRHSHSQSSEQDFSMTRPRSARLSAMSEFGSTTSLNVNELTRKNNQRLRKLDKLHYDNDDNQSSEEILNRFVSANNEDSDLYRAVK